MRFNYANHPVISLRRARHRLGECAASSQSSAAAVNADPGSFVDA